MDYFDPRTTDYDYPLLDDYFLSNPKLVSYRQNVEDRHDDQDYWIVTINLPLFLRKISPQGSRPKVRIQISNSEPNQKAKFLLAAGLQRLYTPDGSREFSSTIMDNASFYPFLNPTVQLPSPQLLRQEDSSASPTVEFLPSSQREQPNLLSSSYAELPLQKHEEQTDIVGGALLLLCQDCLLDIKISITYNGVVTSRFFDFKVGHDWIDKRISTSAWAASKNWFSALEILLENHSARDGLRGKGKFTALSRAAAFGHGDVVKLLLNRLDKEEINERDDSGWDALASATWHAQDTMVRRLLRHEGIRWQYDNKARSPLWWAVYRGFDAIIDIFFDKQFGLHEEARKSITTGDIDGFDPIIVAAISENFLICNLLLDNLGSSEKRTAYLLKDSRAHRRYLFPVIKHRWMLDSSLTRSRSITTHEAMIGGSYSLAHRDLDGKFNAKVVYFPRRKHQSHGDEVGKPPKPYFRDMNVKYLLFIPEEIQQNKSLRWIHLPANNMRWVNTLMKNLYPERHRRILAEEQWESRQYRGSHYRFMRPGCERFQSRRTKGGNLDGKSFPLDPSKFDLFLFLMPFLHWDFDVDRCEREEAIRNKNHPANSDEQHLIKSDFDASQNFSLHPRRTLDRFYYHRLDSTNRRDESQVITRFQDKIQPSKLQRNKNPYPRSEQLRSHNETQNDQKGNRILCTVDQLWLWVIRHPGQEGDTVISCFPGIEKKERGPDSYFISQRAEVIHGLQRDLESSDVQDADHLAKLIVNRCCRNFLYPETELFFGKKDQVLFHDVYEAAIEDILDKESTSFETFKEIQPRVVAEVENDINLIHEIKDVIDELHIMDLLYKDQRNVIENLGGNDSKIEPDEDETDGLDENSTVDLLNDNITNTYMTFQLNAYSGRMEQSKAGLSKQVDRSISIVQGMIMRAKRAHEALVQLVDLKMKHNNVIDTHKSYDQGRSVMALTVATIVFLPLSFMATMFQLNVLQYKRVGENNDMLDLKYVSKFIFGISVPLSLVIMLVVFWMGSTWKLIKGQRRVVGYKVGGIKGGLEKTIEMGESRKARRRLNRSDPEGGDPEGGGMQAQPIHSSGHGRTL